MDRFLDCLAIVLEQETGYKQRPGGPYVRLQVTDAVNRNRVKHGEPLLPLGTYVLGAGGKIRSDLGQLFELPKRADGRAFDDDPHDRGGRTGMGVLQREYDPYRARKGRPRNDVWAIADDEVNDLYRAEYWDVVRCDELPAGVDLVVIDAAINSGVGTAIGRLQMALGLRVDHHIGPETLAAAADADARELIGKISDLRAAYYKRLADFARFGEDWLRRTEEVRTAALHQAEGGAGRPMAALQEIEPSPGRGFDDAKTSMLQSTTARAAEAGGGLSLSLLGPKAAQAASRPGATSVSIVLELLTEPDVWVALGIAASCAYVWIERQRKMREGRG